MTCFTDTSPATVESSAAEELHKAPMRKIWIDGELVDQDQAKVSVFDHGFLYGDGCFEGIRAYNGRVFKLRSHLDRLYRSAKMIRLANSGCG